MVDDVSPYPYWGVHVVVAVMAPSGSHTIIIIIDLKRISHVFREANQCADVLAKMDSRNDIRLCIWEEPPREVALSLLADALSVSFLRE
ncbi:ribonuclease H [Senna tora]|uniref:Ribonuclease H n=1 Tax=Senna tora TaxID=362788 RepID=A0A834SKB7_9FABA|nr:ribonuclease H [Senna tora]